VRVNGVTQTDVRAFIVDFLDDQLRFEGRAVPEHIPDDYDLLLSGLLDSLGLMELTAALGEYCGRELDFEALDPEQMTIVGPLSRFVADEAARA
jgi:acyl carrier protein